MITDTIFALATPPGRGAIAILRLSGPGVDAALSALGAGGLKARMASLRTLTHEGETLDQALVLRFPGPASYTGEDCAELHLHGGRAVVEAVAGALMRLGLRPAEAGNALVAREAAIVTPVAGTTRDVLDAELIIGGYAVTLSDTAGLRVSDDMVEVEGVRRARARAEAAELRLWVRAPGDGPGEAATLVRPGDLTVLTKADLGPVVAEGPDTVVVSTTTGAGLSELHDRIAARLMADLAGSDFPAVTRERHRRRLVEALAAVEAGRAALDHGAEMAGDDLRRAAAALGRVTGAIGVEDILGEVFSTFCIGK